MQLIQNFNLLNILKKIVSFNILYIYMSYFCSQKSCLMIQ